MKSKKLVILGLFVFLSFEVYAQFSVGAKFGYTGSALFTKGLDRSKSFNDGYTFGNTGGLVIQYITEKNFGLQMEVNYIQKGWIEDIDTVTNLFTTTLNYIDVPIMGHAYLGNKNVRYFINAGFYLDYLLSYSEKREGDVAYEDLSIRYIEGRDNKADIGIRAGVGFEILTKAGMFQVEAGFNFGFASVIKKNIDPIPHSVQNQTAAITLGYLIMFNREKAEEKFLNKKK